MAAGPYGLLLSNVNVGYGSRPWGQMGTTQSASSFMTVWNLNSQVKVCFCTMYDKLHMLLVSLSSNSVHHSCLRTSTVALNSHAFIHTNIHHMPPALANSSPSALDATYTTLLPC